MSQLARGVIQEGTEATPDTPRGMRHSTKVAWGVALAAIAVVAAAVMAFALWTARAPLLAGTVTAGDLQLHYESGFWKQITPGVANPVQGTLTEGTDELVTMPGDVVEITVPVTTLVQGENLNGVFRVDIDEEAEDAPDEGPIKATFRVEDEDGVQVGPATGEAEIGDPVQVAGLEGSNAGSPGSWRIVITVNVLGEYRWLDTTPMLDLAHWAVEDLAISLEQTRTGDGFREEGS